jgi:predicted RND superfamily exporter protein
VSSEPYRAPAWIVSYLRWVLSHRIAMTVLLLLATVGAGAIAARGVLSTALPELFFAGNPKYDRHQQLARRFANDEIIAVAFKEPQLATPDVFARLTALEKDLEKLKWVRRVTSVASLEQIVNQDDVLTIRPYGKLAVESAAQAKKALAAIAKDPLYRGVYLGKNQDVTVVLVEPKVDPKRAVELWTPYLAELEKTFAKHGFSGERLHIAGGPTHLHQMVITSRDNLTLLFPIVCVMVVLVVLGLFRSLWPISVTMATALVSVAWTMGLSVAITPRVSIMISVVPAVMLVVAVSDNIHICSSYLLELRAGRSKEDALLRASSEVGLACVYTSITTLLGFASLAFIPAPVIRHMALVLAFGVCIALLVSVTLTPILLSWLPTPRHKASSGKAAPDRLVEASANACLSLAKRRPWLVVVIHVLLLGAAIVGIDKLRVETDLSKRYPPGVPLRVAERFVTQNLAGANFVDLYFQTPKAQGALEPKVFVAADKLAKKARALPQVDTTLSAVDLVWAIHKAIAPKELSAKLPQSRQAIAQYIELFQSSGGGQLGHLLDFERRAMRISLRLNTYGVRTTAEIATKLAKAAQELLPKDTKVEISGLSYLLGDWLDNVVAGQRRGLLFAFLAISLVISFAIRSLRQGLLSMIPNAFPLLLLGGYLGLTRDTVDSDTMMVAIIAIGIAVDDTIHFLTRMRIEQKAFGKEAKTNGLAPAEVVDQALERTMAFSGRAIIKTTLILALGFLPLAAAGYSSIIMMGTLLPLTLIFAVMADLLLLPALIKLDLIRLGTTFNLG